MNAPLPPPGWYPDPTGQRGRRGQRYWNGEKWLDTIPPPPSSAPVNWKVLLPVAGVVLVVVAVGSALINGGDDNGRDTAVSTTSAASVPSYVAPSTTSQPSMRTWMRGAADPVGAVGDALIAIGDAFQNLDFGAARARCPDLRAASDQLERELPSPDQQVTAALQDGIDNFRSLAQLCVNASPAMSQAEQRQMRNYLDVGGSRMCDAYELMGLNTNCR